MPRYQLTIAYDGTHFAGWQKQEPYADAAAGQASVARPPDRQTTRTDDDALEDAQAPPLIVEELPIREGETRPRVALRTVQHVVERAVREVVRQPVSLLGASRTDAGVHARGQVAAFTCSPSPLLADAPHAGWPIERGADRLAMAINARLPRDVLVVDASPTRDDFDPVGDAIEKEYTYSIHAAHERPLFERDFVHHVRDALDASAMGRAAQHLVGEHDFVAFAALHHGRLTTVRTIFACDVEVAEHQPEPPARTSVPAHTPVAQASRPVRAQHVVIRVRGSGFLYNMVRIIAGTLVEVGRGRLAEGAIPAILASKDRRQAGPTLPARGLCLEWIRHRDDGRGASA